MYNRPRIIPCLLLNNGDLVKTKKFKNPNYLGDPINAVKIFNEEEADELCLLDISARKNGFINFDLLNNIVSEAFMPLAYGGGIKELDEAKKLFRMGFEKLIFNTTLTTNKKLIREVVTYAGAQSIVASVDVKKNIFGREECYIDCGQKNIKKSVVDYLKEIEELGVGEILINSIDNDGMMKGYNIELIRSVTANTNLPVIACGGAGSLEDLKSAIRLGGAHAVAAGSIFVYYGSRNAVLINYPKENDLKKMGIY
ncbi:MAG: AglZ/HisF2 family acetamidino modification protein [Lachnospiraceae bacterium]